MHQYQQQRFTMNEAAREVDVHSATIWRWANHGVRGQTLSTFLVGGRRFVAAGDLASFLAAINGRPVKQSDDQERRAANAGAQLDAMGIKAKAPHPSLSTENATTHAGGSGPTANPSATTPAR